MTLRPVLRRLLVAVDASPSSLAALEAAADLALRRRAELAALFVEDINLTRLASHPGVAAFSLLSARRQPLDTGLVEGALKAQSARVRKAVETTAGHRSVTWSFMVRRGRVEAEVLAAAAECDLLVMGWGGRRLGSTARSLLERSSQPLFLLQGAVRPAHPVVVAYDGGPASDRALLLAAELARHDGGEVEVLLPAEGSAERVRTLLEGSGLDVRIRRLGPDGLRGAAHRLPGCVLVLGGPAGEFLADLPCSVVVAR